MISSDSKYGDPRFILPYEEESTVQRLLRQWTTFLTCAAAFPGLPAAYFFVFVGSGAVDLDAVMSESLLASVSIFLGFCLTMLVGPFLGVFVGARGFEMPWGLIPRSLRCRWAYRKLSESYKILDSQPEKALKLAEHAARKCPGPQQLGYLAHVLETLGRDEDAFTTWRAAAQPAKGYRASDRARGLCLIDVGRLAHNRGELWLAESEATKAIRLLDGAAMQHRVGAPISRGMARFERGNDSGAREDFQWALSHSGDPEQQRTARSLLSGVGIVDSVRQRGLAETSGLLGGILRKRRRN